MLTCIIHLFIYTHVCAFIFVYEREKKRKEKWREVAREWRKKEEKVGRGERKG